MKEDAYEGDGLNLYAYCRNNPIVYYDPSGYAANENGKHGEGEELSAKDFPNGFPLIERTNLIEYVGYKEFLKAKIGKRLGYNDIVLGIDEAGYTTFEEKEYKYTKNVLEKHIKDMKKKGYTYSYWVEDIDILYNKSVGKIYFMVDGLQPNENLTEYLANKKYRNLDRKDEMDLRITERELIGILMRESNFKKTTFCFHGDPIPFSVVKEVLNLPVEYE